MGTIKKEFISHWTDKFIEERNKRAILRQDGKLPGIPTGMAELDKRILGWEPKRLYVIAARPGVGKTTLGLQFAVEASIRGKKTIFFSIEMPGEELALKVNSYFSDVNSHSLRMGLQRDIDFDASNNAADRVKGLPLIINDCDGRHLETLLRKSREYKDRGAEFIIIDYLQKITIAGSNESKYMQVSKVSAELKEMTKYLDIPILALAQVNRSAVIAGDEFGPELHQLRDSGEIEHEADVIMFIHKPANTKEGDNYPDILNCQKNRAGCLFHIELDMRLEFSQINQKGHYVTNNALSKRSDGPMGNRSLTEQGDY